MFEPLPQNVSEKLSPIIKQTNLDQIWGKQIMQTNASILQAVNESVDSIKTGDVDQIILFFDKGCIIELLGITLSSYEGVNRRLK